MEKYDGLTLAEHKKALKGWKCPTVKYEHEQVGSIRHLSMMAYHRMAIKKFK
jgi:hypothetical protein